MFCQGTVYMDCLLQIRASGCHVCVCGAEARTGNHASPAEAVECPQTILEPSKVMELPKRQETGAITLFLVPRLQEKLPDMYCRTLKRNGRSSSSRTPHSWNMTHPNTSKSLRKPRNKRGNHAAPFLSIGNSGSVTDWDAP